MVGWAGRAAATDAEDVVVGVKLPWVELDGVRYTDVTSARFVADDEGVATCQLVLDVIGAVEIVYTDSKGEPLPGAPVLVEDPAALGELDHASAVDRPGPG
jgi:hypothetical protein